MSSIGRAGAGDLVGVLVEREVADREHRVLRLGERQRRAADEPAQARDDLLEAERLGDVIVAARGEARDAVVEGVLRGEEQHGRLGAVGAHALQHLEPVDVGEHDVEHDRVGPELAGDLHGAEAVGGGAHVPPLVPQGHLQQLGERVLVVDDEHAHHRAVALRDRGARCWLVGAVLMSPVSASTYAFPMTFASGCRVAARRPAP